MDTPETGDGQLQGSLPIISDETGQRVIKELGMDVGEVSRGTTDAPESNQNTSEMRKSLAEDIFSSIAEVNPELVKTLQQTIESNGPKSALMRDDIIEGMAVVIRAFDVDSDYKLANNFANIGQGDMQRVSNIVAESLGGSKDRDLLEAVLATPKIPEQQAMLNRVIEKAAQASVVRARGVKLGAAVMYGVLSEMRPRLYPPKPPTLHLDTPPPTGA